jgi:acyl-CoA hydrolase
MADQTPGHPSNEPIGRPTAYSRVTLSRIMTAVDVDVAGQPRAVPPVLPEDMEDQRRFREALIRREHRLARRTAIQKAWAE